MNKSIGKCAVIKKGLVLRNRKDSQYTWQIDIERKHVIFEHGKMFISRHILHQHRYTYPTLLQVRQNPHYISLFECSVSYFRTSGSTFANQLRTALRDKHFPL
jgi:hypothetical protein